MLERVVVALLAACLLVPAGADAKRKKVKCPAKTTQVKAGKTKVCAPAALPTGLAGMRGVADRAFEHVKPFPKRTRRWKAADRHALGLLAPPPAQRRARIAQEGTSGLGEPTSSTTSGNTQVDRWSDVERYDGGDVEMRVTGEDATGDQIGTRAESLLTVTRPDGAAATRGQTIDHRRARCPTADGVAEGRVAFGVVKGASGVAGTSIVTREARVLIEGTMTGNVGAAGKLETFDVDLRGTTEIRGHTKPRKGRVKYEGTRTYRTRLVLKRLPIGTDLAQRPQVVSMLKQMTVLGPKGHGRASAEDVELGSGLATATLMAIALFIDDLRKGDRRWYDYAQCAKVERVSSSPDQVEQGGQATWNLRTVAADGAEPATATWTAESGCGAIDRATATGSTATFSVADAGGRWEKEPGCIDAEAVSTAGRSASLYHEIPPRPKAKRYRYSIALEYREDMGDGITPTRMTGLGSVAEATVRGGLFEGTGSFVGTEWDGTVANPCGHDMQAERGFGGDAVVGVDMQEDDTVTVAFSNPNNPFRMSWIESFPLTGGTRELRSDKPFCGTPGLARTATTLTVTGTPLED